MTVGHFFGVSMGVLVMNRSANAARHGGIVEPAQFEYQ